MDGMLILWIVLLILGLGMLVKGADFFVDGAAGIAHRCGVSPLVVGLTVVAFGTSAPELAVSVASAISHSTDIAIGNVVGSNICNILLILGLSALVHPLPVQRNSLVLDLPVLLIASGLLIGLGVWGNALNWWDGLILLAVFSVYLVFLFRNAKREHALLKPLAEGAKAAPASNGTSAPAGDASSESAENTEAPAEGHEKQGFFAKHKNALWFLITLTLVGLGMVVGGGTLLVEGAKYVANYLGVPQRIIGLTVVAIGTSLPELVTSVVVSAEGETDIAVGNIIGSNIFNIFLVAGVASLFYPLAFSVETNLIDALVAFGAAALLAICALVGRKKLGRVAGGVLLCCFLGYYIYLFLAL